MCEIIYIDETSVIDDVIVALGEFDGVHLGHQELLNVTKRLSEKYSFKSAMITFNVDPDYVLDKREYEGHLTSVKEKARVLSTLGVDYLFVLDFASICNLEPEEFYELYLSKFKGIVCGFDYKFGYMGKGTSSFVKEKFEICEVVEEVLFYGRKISSSDIRKHLSKGKISLVNEFLGRPYSLDVGIETIGKDVLGIINYECYIPLDGTYKCEYFINEYESFVCFSIIEGTVLKLLDVSNVNVGDDIRVQLLERIESGV